MSMSLCASSITPNTLLYLVRFAYNRLFIRQNIHKKLKYIKAIYYTSRYFTPMQDCTTREIVLV